MNLHLYIPGLVAHPSGCLQGAIYGNALRYWQQNTHITDFMTIMAILENFTTHLKNRGHTMILIERIM
jgi:hypothetical protein